MSQNPDCITAHYNRLTQAPFGLDLLPLEEVLAKEPGEGFMQCCCGEYLHYGWCHHACGWALRKGVIKGFDNLGQRNPTRVRKRGATGTGKKKGGSLTVMPKRNGF